MAVIGRKMEHDIHTVFNKLNHNTRTAFGKYHPVRKINNTLHTINNYATPLAGIPLIGQVATPLKVAEQISKGAKMFEDSYVHSGRHKPHLER
jgi:hypothetical protein